MSKLICIANSLVLLSISIITFSYSQYDIPSEDIHPNLGWLVLLTLTLSSAQCTDYWIEYFKEHNVKS